MKEKLTITENGKVFYLISDSWDEQRETIFFFHGLTADHTMFEAQLDYFEGKYNLIAWDAPCHGKSRPFDKFSFDITTEIILRIMAENNVAAVAAVGQSLGGYYIQALIARHPEKVKAFIGIGTSPYGIDYYSRSDIFWLKQVEWIGMCCPEGFLKKAAAKNATDSEAGYENMMKMTSAYTKKEYCRLMQNAYSAFLADNRVLEIRCPVLITHGKNDRTGKVRQYCRMWHEQTGYPLVVINNAGHNANVDNPDEMNAVIGKFLQDNGI